MNAETKAAQTVYQARADVKRPEDVQDALDERFARFALRPLGEADVWMLGMATMVMPDGNPGPEAYLTQVSGTDVFADRLTVWGRVVAIGIAHAGYRAAGGSRRRTFVEGYSEAWGRYAVADGLTLALYGKAPGLVERCEALKCGKQGYQRIRDFVGGALVNAIAEFRVALAWAGGFQRDRVLAGRWEGVTGLNWDDARAAANIAGDGPGSFPMFALGCGRADTKSDADDTLKPDPETVYYALRPCDWWDAAYAKRMRDAPVSLILTPPRN